MTKPCCASNFWVCGLNPKVCISNEIFWSVPSCIAVLTRCSTRFDESVDEILKCYRSNESYWAVLSCGAVYYAVQGDSDFWLCEWKCDHSNIIYGAVLSRGMVYYAVQGGSNFWVCGWNPTVWLFKWKLSSRYFAVVPFVFDNFSQVESVLELCQICTCDALN